MEMTKKITSLLLILIIFFAFTNTSGLADSDPYYNENMGPIYTETEYDGIYYFDDSNKDSPNDVPFIEDAVVTIKNGTVKFEFVENNVFYSFTADEYRTFGLNTTWEAPFLMLYGKPKEDIYLHRIYFWESPQGDSYIELILRDQNSNQKGYGGIFTKAVEPQSLETSFMQKVTTDSGQYEMYISGFLNATVVNGENVLTADDIKSQSISIHVKNTKTGETRVMTQSTIEGLTLNVSDGSITSITLNGRVQTSKGTLERYTTTVNV